MPSTPNDKPIPGYQKAIAVIALVLIVVWITLGWHRFLSDFWPPDRSFVGPNIVASVVTWAGLLVIAALLYPPIRRRILRFVDHKANAIKAHIDKGHAELHAKLDEGHRMIRHVIEHHPDIPPLPPKENP